MSGQIRVLLADDEPLAREGLRVRLAREPDMEIVAEAADGPAAIEAILAHRPDLVFLDVQMPGCDGFEVLARVAGEHLPAVIFVTAYDRYALRAFAVHAADYLLKPIAHRRLQEALRRVRSERERDASAMAAERLRQLLEAREADQAPASRDPAGAGTPAAAPFLLRFTVRDGDRYILLRVADVDWIEAAANYLRLHTGKRSFQVRMTMAELERQLDPAHFVRIHRSTIVNLDRIAGIAPDLHGEYEVTLHGGATLRLSRGYRDRLL